MDSDVPAGAALERLASWLELDLLTWQAADCLIRWADFVLIVSVEEIVCALTSVEICAGAGGQALGLEWAGFAHTAAVEIDPDACETLRLNRGSDWKIVEGDVYCLDGREFRGVDLIAGGVPCPPFSIAGKQLGSDDSRDLFPQALRLVEEIAPRAVLLENVRGLSARRFDSYRAQVVGRLNELGYRSWWNLVHASEHGLPQLRPRFVLVAVREPCASHFRWPGPSAEAPPTVGETLYDLMSSGGWPGAETWRRRARSIAPTIVGGSKKHGGPDLGPTRAREAWKILGVNGLGIATDPPGPDFPLGQPPKLTLRMVARLQGFPDDWQFAGRKTSAYRQVGNAFPPPIAKVLGIAIRDALNPVTPADEPVGLDHHTNSIRVEQLPRTSTERTFHLVAQVEGLGQATSDSVALSAHQLPGA